MDRHTRAGWILILAALMVLLAGGQMAWAGVLAPLAVVVALGIAAVNESRNHLSRQAKRR